MEGGTLGEGLWGRGTQNPIEEPGEGGASAEGEQADRAVEGVHLAKHGHAVVPAALECQLVDAILKGEITLHSEVANGIAGGKHSLGQDGGAGQITLTAGFEGIGLENNTA